mmetsp:Transcript_5455/g.13970  ORF Transcript_5455/g.13970 Transcript_5455/m.13970 type:complete len:346 (-) Transcript_5455:92-1129(-)
MELDGPVRRSAMGERGSDNLQVPNGDIFCHRNPLHCRIRRHHAHQRHGEGLRRVPRARGRPGICLLHRKHLLPSAANKRDGADPRGGDARPDRLPAVQRRPPPPLPQAALPAKLRHQKGAACVAQCPRFHAAHASPRGSRAAPPHGRRDAVPVLEGHGHGLPCSDPLPLPPLRAREERVRVPLPRRWHGDVLHIEGRDRHCRRAQSHPGQEKAGRNARGARNVPRILPLPHALCAGAGGRLRAAGALSGRHASAHEALLPRRVPEHKGLCAGTAQAHRPREPQARHGRAEQVPLQDACPKQLRLPGLEGAGQAQGKGRDAGGVQGDCIRRQDPQCERPARLCLVC